MMRLHRITGKSHYSFGFGRPVSGARPWTEQPDRRPRSRSLRMAGRCLAGRWGLTVIVWVSLLLCGAAHQGSAFSLNGYKWPSGSDITVYLQLGARARVALQDGSASWEESAAD